ncbi:hypothetical protein BST61_g8225 [Cercospora zeina]
MSLEDVSTRMIRIGSKLFMKCQDADTHYRAVQGRAMLAGFPPVEPYYDSDNGVFADHALDDPAASILGLDELVQAHVEEWLDGDDHGLQLGNNPPPSTSLNKCVSVNFGEAHSANEAAGPPNRRRLTRNRNWQQKCEETRIIAQKDMERFDEPFRGVNLIEVQDIFSVYVEMAIRSQSRHGPQAECCFMDRHPRHRSLQAI